jgi:hypothetical protein
MVTFMPENRIVRADAGASGAERMGFPAARKTHPGSA